MAVFGRKKVVPPAGRGGGGQDPRGLPGHQAVLHHLTEQERSEPGIRERVAGGILFDLACQFLNDDRGVRLEHLLAALASTGGQQCIVPILATASGDMTMEQLGLTVVQGKDGRHYFFGDAPNRLLLESQDSLLSLAFGAAQALGAPVTMAMIHDEMRKVASAIGGPDFEDLDLPPQNRVDRPSEWVRLFGQKFIDALDLYEVPPMRRATAFGFAIQRAMDAGKHSLDPLIAARIVLACATRTAKFLVR
jgi:hypothetical protein